MPSIRTGTRALRPTGANLAKAWNLNVRHALYREKGDWYHQLREFPGALLDAEGYVLFDSSAAFRECLQLTIRKDVHVPGGIKQIPGYMRVRAQTWRLEAATELDFGPLLEGKAIRVQQTRYERDPDLRRACIQAHGIACCICGLNFEKRYGEIGRGYIQVHHIEPLAATGKAHRVDPVKDLVPVCPNCHAMLHRCSPPLLPAALGHILKR